MSSSPTWRWHSSMPFRVEHLVHKDVPITIRILPHDLVLIRLLNGQRRDVVCQTDVGTTPTLRFHNQLPGPWSWIRVHHHADAAVAHRDGRRVPIAHVIR